MVDLNLLQQLLFQNRNFIVLSAKLPLEVFNLAFLGGVQLLAVLEFFRAMVESILKLLQLVG